MGIKYLAVDSDKELAYSEAAAWAERGIEMDIVDTMTEGIAKLMANSYLYVGINSDAVDFMPLLSTMRSVTNTPILIATTKFTTQAEVDALNNGADLFASFQKDVDGNISPEGNIASVLAHITRMSERNAPPCKVLVYNNLLVAPKQRYVFVGNEKIDLTRQEFDLLHFLVINHGNVLEYEQIYRIVWNEEYDENTHLVIKTAIGRLRKKITGEDTDNSLIENVRGVGYRFLVNFER
jgi:two-component system OmpR family response regulator